MKNPEGSLQAEKLARLFGKEYDSKPSAKDQSETLSLIGDINDEFQSPEKQIGGIV